ncbi:heme lyase subunit CcmF [Oceanobacillus picturae]|jgi:hypothetical protein|uniref:Heme lyase subunit CcmF n=1 Tax=Oceanobacillus picturae TaxID=171693 RepID=W9BE16_9BACI|nr:MULTISPECIES: hypothetical protein [Oceanobacillus]GAQ17120.1 heme lyase subunit CcmF [Oceanobacillus picturae]CDO04490.1 hypothetical protein BN988_03050 [Oceanobacillus picturae]
MKKLLVALFAVLIVGFGVIGYTQVNDDATEIVDENSHSISVQS